MITLDVEQDNIEEIEKIHDNNSFPFPDLSNPLYISKKMVISGNSIIGAGFVRLTAEGILILDPSKARSLRVIAGVHLIDSLRNSVKSKGLDECHVFVKNLNVQQFLSHLGFKYCNGGDPMVIHF